MNSRANTNVVSEVLGNTGYSSVGTATDCKRLQRSEGPWFGSGWPDMFRASAYMRSPFRLANATRAPRWKGLAFVQSHAAAATVQGDRRGEPMM